MNEHSTHTQNTVFSKKARIMCILITSVTLIFFFVVGCLMWLRPEVSESEKRTLNAFPEFTLESFISGQWTSEISLWYSDTYPMREGMIGANDAIHTLYGISSDTYSQSSGVADDIDTDKGIDKDKLNTDNIVIDKGEEAPATAEEAPATEEAAPAAEEVPAAE